MGPSTLLDVELNLAIVISPDAEGRNGAVCCQGVFPRKILARGGRRPMRPAALHAGVSIDALDVGHRIETMRHPGDALALQYGEELVCE